MLKNISNLGSVLSRTEQKAVQGGQTLMCIIMCGPGEGGIPIYNDPFPGDPNPVPEEVGCACTGGA
jgi:hypothetical protein